MKKFLLIALIFTSWTEVVAQTVTIESPAGLTYPYEVTSGTQVTFRWSYVSEPTAFFTYTEAPVFPDFDTDSAWKQYTNFVDQGDGTYLITLTVNEPLHVWGGFFSSWISQWYYSNIIELGILSGVTITSSDGLLCPGGADTEVLQVTGTYNSYQWYFNNEPIEGATAATYAAKEEGYYKVQVPQDNKLVFSNTRSVKVATIEMTGALSSATQLTLTATEDMTSYQWLSGTNASSLSPISSATSSSYEATLGTSTVYYAAQGVVAGCTVRSEARPASKAMFEKPKIVIDAEENEFGKICVGTPATFSVTSEYATYEWYNDGVLYSDQPSFEVTSMEGNMIVHVTTASWPEVELTSDPAAVIYFAPVVPILTGVEAYAAYCPGSTLNITLGDEGYTYDWYVHQSYFYEETDKVEVDGYEYDLTFEHATYLTVVARYLGCESENKLYLDSYENAYLYLELDDQEKAYLCPGSTATMALPEYMASDYTGFQWYKLNGEEYTAVNGETSSSYAVSVVGTYLIDAHPKTCPSVLIRSAPVTISDYQERELWINSDKWTLCIGEQATLSVSDEWTNLQWFEKKLVIGQSGYETTYSPLSNVGNVHSLVVDEFKTYLVKAKHVSCSAGLKTSSHPFELLPTLHPEITPDPNAGIERWHQAPYDSIPNYLYCSEADLTLSVPDEFTSYQWHKLEYSGDDDYAPGDAIEGATGPSLETEALGAEWYTAKVESDGCSGWSRAVLIDTWVHSTPDIGVVDNSELCSEGDSTLLYVAFYGDWVKYEWYMDGELIPDSDNDSLYAKAPGGYTVTGYPSSCPHIGYSSGLPVDVTNYPKAWIEETDELIYAMPEEGFYYYQWYKDGEPIETGNDRAYVIYKSYMTPGVYTVEVTNSKDCSSISDGYVWTVTAVEDDITAAIHAYPNPTTGLVTITGVEQERLRAVNLYDLQGQQIKSVFTDAFEADLSRHPAGVYIVEVVLHSGLSKKIKLVRK